MKKWLFILPILGLLTGCAAEDTIETIADEILVPAMAEPKQISVDLPDGVLAPVLDSEGQQIYLCDGYEILIETREAGDLNETIQSLSGYEREDITVMSIQGEEATRYEFVWACAGEGGDRLGRGIILDDGNYHYCMSVLRDASAVETSQIVWPSVFRSFRVV